MLMNPRVAPVWTGWFLALCVGLCTTGLAFWLLATPDQRVYTVAWGVVSLQADMFSGLRLTLPSWGRPAPAHTIVQAAQQTPGWLSTYHQLLWQAGVAGLLSLGVLYGAAPQRFTQPWGRRMRHVRGPRVRLSRHSLPLGQAVQTTS